MISGKLKKLCQSKGASVLPYGYLVSSFFILDVWLRVQTRWIGEYSIYEPAPNLFTLVWCVLLTVLVTGIPSRQAGKTVYAVLYFACMLYAAAQYASYLVLGKFLYLSDFLLAGEGAGYASWAVDLLSPSLLLQVLFLAGMGVLGMILYPAGCQVGGNAGRHILIHVLTACMCALFLIPIPALYGSTAGEDQWDDFDNPAFEYEQFTNVNFDLELTGMYQFVARDFQVQLGRRANRAERINMIDSFFDAKPDHEDNAMTGMFEGKNVIVVMMETVDDWVITEEDTPTLYRMMSEGIRFDNFYTPQYSNGYTFNTEFAFNTSVYPYSNGNVAYSLLRNTFDRAIAGQFAREGYSSNSYHAGLATFYNRGQMHEVWGYEKYHSYQDYPQQEVACLDDRYLVESDELYSDIVSGVPFFSFVITYSPHLPFTDEDELAGVALEAYPEYDVQTNREEAILRAKARLTDDMFAGLLARLEADGLLKDTVIVCFGDHYAYGLTDREHLQKLSEDAGCAILEKTPAFIYCADSQVSMKVEKVMQITDLAPTIMNLLGIEVPKELMGHDIFDENYPGYVIFPNGTWLTNTTYVKDGIIQWNDGMTDEEMAQMNAYVRQLYQVNNAILDSDYYAQKGEGK